jgi:hypothetical protein
VKDASRRGPLSRGLLATKRKYKYIFASGISGSRLFSEVNCQETQQEPKDVALNEGGDISGDNMTSLGDANRLLTSLSLKSIARELMLEGGAVNRFPACTGMDRKYVQRLCHEDFRLIHSYAQLVT